MNHMASNRQYIEVFMVKVILRFPDVAIADPKFFSTMLDPRISKPQICASMLTITGVIMTSELATQDAVMFKKKIFEHLVGFSTSNSAHARCIAQFYLLRVQNDKQYGSAFTPAGVRPILDYLTASKDIKRMMEKY